MQPIAAHVARSVVSLCLSTRVLGLRLNRAETDEPIVSRSGGHTLVGARTVYWTPLHIGATW